jgi:hypothetical protein
VSELVGVMLVASRFMVHTVNNPLGERSVTLKFQRDSSPRLEWLLGVSVADETFVLGSCIYLDSFTTEQPSPAAIDTAIAQAYDAFCLQYDIWRRASHIEWLPVLPMSLGVEPGQRSGTWSFAAGPAPKATSPEGQAPSGGKQKQHGKKRNDSAAGKAGVGRRSKRG